MTKAPLLVLACLVLSSSLPALDKGAPGPAAFPAPPDLFSPVGPPNSVAEIDRNGLGIIDFRAYYDEKGKVSREELDYNDDGKMDTFYYYKDGVLQRVEIDSRFNGKVDIWIYLLDGKYVRRYERDTTGSGKPDIVRDYGTD